MGRSRRRFRLRIGFKRQAVRPSDGAQAVRIGVCESSIAEVGPDESRRAGRSGNHLDPPAQRDDLPVLGLTMPEH